MKLYIIKTSHDYIYFSIKKEFLILRRRSDINLFILSLHIIALYIMYESLIELCY